MLRRRAREAAYGKCEMEMTPMIDVTFQLLIFFMCTLRFESLEGKLGAFLPKDVGASRERAPEEPRAEVRIRVVEAGRRLDPRTGEAWSGRGRYVLDASRRLEYGVGPRRTGELAELARLLRDLHQRDPGLTASLEAGPGVIYSEAVAVLDLLQAADFEEVLFVGAPAGR